MSLAGLQVDAAAPNVAGHGRSRGGDAGIGQAVRDGYTLDYLRDAIARIIGADHPHLDLLTDLTPAIAFHRSTYRPEVLDPDKTADEIVSLIQSIARHPTA